MYHGADINRKEKDVVNLGRSSNYYTPLDIAIINKNYGFIEAAL